MADPADEPANKSADNATAAPRRLRRHHADLRGAVRLATEATAGLTDLVEAMHARIARVPGLGAAPADGRTRGLTGLVYGTVRGVTRGVGGSIDALLALLGPALGDPAVGLPEGSPERDAVVAALNGVLGDHLAASGNPLSIEMRLRYQGRPLPLPAAGPMSDAAVAPPAQDLASCLPPRDLAASLEGAGPRLLVLLHGLCMSDGQWRRDGHDHGLALARDAGYTPVYLRYNSGLHVSANGLAISHAMQQLLRAWPQPLQRVVLLGHSMGGLVARSALHQAQRAGQVWPGRVDDLVCLGTPHQGAPLERAGHWVDLLLGAAPYAAPLARLGQVRSAGITDLRHGYLLEADWAGRSRFARTRADHRRPVPLPDGVRCWAVAASIGAKGGDLKDRLLGDGLVPLDSALGRHADPAHALAFAPERQWVGFGMNHLDLLNRPEVYQRLREWLA